MQGPTQVASSLAQTSAQCLTHSRWSYMLVQKEVACSRSHSVDLRLRISFRSSNDFPNPCPHGIRLNPFREGATKSRPCQGQVPSGSRGVAGPGDLSKVLIKCRLRTKDIPGARVHVGCHGKQRSCPVPDRGSSSPLMERDQHPSLKLCVTSPYTQVTVALPNSLLRIKSQM